MAVTVAVIVVSFNRPNFLREALASVVAGRPDEVILVDDGSDAFDALQVCGREFVEPSNAAGRGIVWRFVGAPPLTVDERMRVPRQGSLINQALAMVTSDCLTYLCDDDLHAPGWYDALRAVWAAEPGRELVRGEWRWFAEGIVPTEDCPLVPLDARQMTAGNFAHHASLTRDRGVRWPENRLNCLDDGFLSNLTQAGVGVVGVPSAGFAGWRREHAKINGRYSDGRNHSPEFRQVLEAGVLE